LAVASQSADAAEFVHASGIAPRSQATAEQNQSADKQIAVVVRRLADRCQSSGAFAAIASEAGGKVLVRGEAGCGAQFANQLLQSVVTKGFVYLQWSGSSKTQLRAKHFDVFRRKA
jgi:hypothetical protein